MKILKNFIQLMWLIVLLPLTLTIAQPVDSSSNNIIMIPVNDYSQQELAEVLPSAMGQALVKMSGNAQVLTTPGITNALTKAQEYMESYDYHQEYRDGIIQLMVRVVFNRKALNQLLEQNDQNLWASKPLPQILVWIKTNQTEDMMGAGNPISNELLKQATNVGLPIILPEMDLQDNNIVGVDQNLLFNGPTLKLLAQRYAVEAVLVGEIEPGKNKQWLSHWKLFWRGQFWEWQRKGRKESMLADEVLHRLNKVFTQPQTVASPASLNQNQNNQIASTSSPMNTGIAPAAAGMANPASASSTTSGMSLVPSTPANNSNNSSASSSYGFMVRISGVNDLNDYTEVMNYLRHLSAVTNVSVSHMDKGDLVVQVEAIGGKNSLSSILLTSSRLRLLSDSSSSILHYEWHKKSVIHKTKKQQTVLRPLMQFINDNS